MSDTEDTKKKSKIVTSAASWINKKWRPMMGWTYMGTVIADFVIFPVLWNVAQIITKTPITQWEPLTLKANGFFHMTMCAVIGVAAWGRTQEKLAGVENDPVKKDTNDTDQK